MTRDPGRTVRIPGYVRLRVRVRYCQVLYCEVYAQMHRLDRARSSGNVYFLFTLDVARRGCGLRDTSKKITCVGGAVTIEQYSKKGCKTADKTAPFILDFGSGPTTFRLFRSHRHRLSLSVARCRWHGKLINDTTKVTTGSRRVSTRPKIRTTTPSGTIILDIENSTNGKLN